MTEAVNQPPLNLVSEKQGRFASFRQRFGRSEPSAPVYPILYSPATEMPRFEGPAVRDEWVDAVVKGIVDFPRFDIGIGTYLASALINNPPKNWNDFALSNLSQAQIERMGVQMTNYHRSRGIEGVHSAQAPKAGEIVVGDERIYKIWRSARSSTILLIKQNVPAGDLNRVLSQPENVQSLAQKIESLIGILTTEQLAELVKVHKQVLNKKVLLKERAESPVLVGIAESSGLSLNSEDSRETIDQALLVKMESLIKEYAEINDINVANIVR